MNLIRLNFNVSGQEKSILKTSGIFKTLNGAIGILRSEI